MGQLIASYPSSVSIREAIIKTLVAILLLVCPPVAIGLWRYYSGYTQFGVVPADIWSRTWFSLAFINFLFCLLFFLSLLARHRQFVIIYELGLAIRSGLSRIYSLDWDQLTGILTSFIQERILHLDVRNDLNVTLQLKDGSTISLPHSLENFSELISRIKACLYPRLMPGIQADFTSGKFLNFGAVGVQTNKLILQNDKLVNCVLDLNQVEEITITSGSLLINLKNQVPKKVMVSKIMNLEILLHLLKGEVNNEMA